MSIWKEFDRQKIFWFIENNSTAKTNYSKKVFSKIKMSLHLDTQYARLLNLDQFKETQKNYFNFRCPICGDSAKSKTKKRGWLIPSKDNQGLFFNCFNCSASMTMSFFIFKIQPSLLKSYNKEKFEETNSSFSIKSEIVNKPKIETKNEIVKNITSIIQLPNDHVAAQYLFSRHISNTLWNEIYYTQNYKKWIVENYLPGKYEHTNFEDHRIVFPLYTLSGELIGLQGRSLNQNDKIRFLTVKIRETTTPMCYGLNKINILDEYVFVVEGIFDSLVIPNSIAMLKSNMDLKFLKEKISSQKIIFVFDNEPRNKEIVKNYDSIANNDDFGLFVWPKNIGVKDLNELAVRQNQTPDQIKKFVCQHSFFGKLKKKIQISEWKIL